MLAVAILPLLGVGGTQLFRAETPGPMKDQKLTPRIAETARGAVDHLLRAVARRASLAYRAAGMGWADALHAHVLDREPGRPVVARRQLRHWNSPLLEAVAMVFMLLSGVSFALYFVAWQQRSLRVLWRDPELRAYLRRGARQRRSDRRCYLPRTVDIRRFGEALRHAAFNVVSVATTGGFATADYAQWPPFAPVLMMLLGCFATCAGSTGGGIKMIRMLLLLKQAQRELARIVHPRRRQPGRDGRRRRVSPRVHAERARLHADLRRDDRRR